MSRPVRRYRFGFIHPLYPSIIRIETDAHTPCAARNLAWQTLEAQIRASTDMPHDNYWKLAEQEYVGLPDPA